MMFFLQHWNPTWKTRFSPQKNTVEAEAFRSSLMVAAVSFGVGRDMRADFRGLGFPLDDAVYTDLTTEVTTHRPSAEPIAPHRKTLPTP